MGSATEYPLGLRLAEYRINEFADEKEKCLIDHEHAMECFDCQDWLQKGIDAFNQLQKSEAEIREAACAKLIDLTPSLQQHIDSLYASWLAPCPSAAQWIERLIALGHRPDNLDEFYRAWEAVRETIEDREWARMSFKAMVADMAHEAG